jgi:hypothetical protein
VGVAIELVYPWVRLTVPLGLEPERDAVGWVVPAGRGQLEAAVPLSDRFEAPVVLLLGERGIGKSCVLKHEHERLLAQSEDAILVDFARLSTASARDRVIGALTGLNGTVRYLLLDGIDDAPVALEADRFIGEVLRELGEAARSRLRLRISCRTSRRSQLLEEHLREIWGTAVSEVTVAGLTRDDVIAAARIHRLDAEAFVGRLEHGQLVVPLASGPVTLVPLLKAAVAGHELPKDAVAAYRLACTQLCTEPEKTTFTDTRDRSFAPAELVALACKAAAAVQFLAQDGLTQHAGAAESLSFADLAQGSEPVDGGESVQATEAGYHILMQAGLLVGAGEGRWSFAHRSFQEFLAAEYLRVRNVKTAVRDSLLLVGDGDSRRVATMHRDVAAWLALSDRGLFAHMLRSDPQVLLLGDLSVLCHEDRARVFDALLTFVRGGGVLAADWSMLRRLSGDLLASRIAPLVRADQPLDELHLALSVANACKCGGLTDALLSLAGNEHLPSALRSLALNAVTDDLQRDHVARLREMLNDPEPDVAAHVLDLLIPHGLTTQELLANLPVPRLFHIGHAWGLIRRLPELIADEELHDGVVWACTAFRGEVPEGGRDAEALADAATVILARAVTACAGDGDGDGADLVEPLAQAFLALVDGPHRYTELSGSHALQEVLGRFPAVRRAVARVVLQRASTEQVSHLSSSSSNTLFHAGADSGYWALEFAALPPSARKLLRVPLIRVPDNEDEWADALELAELHPELHELIKHWGTCPNPKENWERDAYHANRAREQERQAKREERRYDEAELPKAIAAIRSDAPDLREAWRRVVYNLHCAFQGEQISTPGRLDISGAPHYPRQQEPLAEALLGAARTVLLHAPAITPEMVAAQGLTIWHDVPELYALGLLAARSAVPELETARSTGLAIALICSEGSEAGDPESRAALLRLCAARSAGRLEQILPDIFGQLRNLALLVAIATLLRAEPAHAPAVLDWALDTDRPAAEQAKILSLLAATDCTEALGVLRDAIDVLPSMVRWASDSPGAQLWLEAAGALMVLGDAHGWTRILAVLEHEPRLTPQLLKMLVESSRADVWPLGKDQISAADLGRLYTLMARHVPMPDGFTSGFVDDDQEILRLFQSLPGIIANRSDLAALRTLRALARSHPEQRQVRAVAEDLEQRLLDLSWKPPGDLHQFVQVTSGGLNRVVNDQFQLRDAVLESLARLQDRLLADNGWSTALWNFRTVDKQPPAAGKATLWWPTLENDISDFVATFLSYDLADRGVVVNREVQVTRPGLNGSRTDIQIQAQVPGHGEPDPITVVIETKGCWNRELPTGLEQQLVGKYLLRPGRRAGIYLIAYFDDSAWAEDEDGARGRAHEQHTPESILVAQRQIADRELRIHHVSATPVVLDCRLPAARLRDPSADV